MIRIPAETPRIIISDLPAEYTIVTIRKKYVIVNKNQIYRFKNVSARKFLINKLWKMTQKK